MAKPLIKNILVAINGSQSSIQAAMYGIILAKQNDFNMKVVYVVDTATIKFLTASKLFINEEKESYEADLNSDGKKYLEYVTSLAKSKGVIIETELRTGSVYTEVVNATDAFEADMILIGGNNSLNNYFKPESGRHSIQATARSEIVNFAHCPVLVIHKPEIEGLFKIS